jgi:hypothetical protein
MGDGSAEAGRDRRLLLASRAADRQGRGLNAARPLAARAGLHPMLGPDVELLRPSTAIMTETVSAAVLPIKGEEAFDPIPERDRASRPWREAGHEGGSGLALMQEEDRPRALADHRIGFPQFPDMGPGPARPSALSDRSDTWTLSLIRSLLSLARRGIHPGQSALYTYGLQRSTTSHIKMMVGPGEDHPPLLFASFAEGRP